MSREVDPEFLSLPLPAVADAALETVRSLGAEHGDVRVHRLREQHLSLHDAAVDTSSDTTGTSFAVRVVHEGAWGFAAGVDLTPDEARRVAAEAAAVARLSAALGGDRVELAPEPAHGDVRYVSSYELDPFEVTDAEKIALLEERSRTLLSAREVDHVDAAVTAVRETSYYADLAGTTTTQQRVRVHPEVTVTRIDADRGGFDTMRTLAPPVGRGWEYLTGTGWDWDAELAELPRLVAERASATSVEPGRYDLVIDPSNLWLTIHESVGHATELDRALGYEANYAGTSFATPDLLGTLRYGSEHMTVTGDRQVEHGLATVGWDDEGVAAQTWDLVRDGRFVGYQLDRRIAALQGLPRSNGCAYADSGLHVPIQRMANVTLHAAADGPSTAQLIAGVEDGIYVVGDKSWSIDMQRYNFQFTAQRFYRIRSGRLAEPLRDVAYQATTTDFWRSLRAVGGPQTFVLGGAMNCGKGQPGQIAAVSHGCPATVFRGVNVLNTAREGAR